MDRFRFRLGEAPPLLPLPILAFPGSRMVHSLEHAALEMKELAITQMINMNYGGAWHSLNRAKDIFPALRNLDHMLFVCRLLRSADAGKPYFGLNWIKVLRLPASANIATIQSQFNHFIDWLEVIKIEFPGTAIAQGILENAKIDFCKRENFKHVNLRPDVYGLGSANTLADRGSFGGLKRKLHTADCSSKRVTRNASSLNKSVKLNNVDDVTEKEEDVSEKEVLGPKCKDVDEHCKVSTSEISDIAIENEEESAVAGQKIMEPASQTTGTLESKIVGEEIDDGVGQCQSNNGDDSGNQILDSTRQITDSDGILERAIVSSECIKEQCLSSELKMSVFEALPQNPHYKSLDAMSKEFRESIITGIESSFVVVANQIRCLVTVEDVERNVSSISNQLKYLESMGYDVHKMKGRVDEICTLVEQKQASLVASQEGDNELKEWKDQSRAFESKNCMIRSLIAGKEEEIQRLKQQLVANQSLLDFQNARVVEIEEQWVKQAEECYWLESEIEWTAKLPW